MARLIWNSVLANICGCLTMSLISSSASDVPTVKLSSGFDMPAVGLRVWQLKQKNVIENVTNALNSGYKHFAPFPGNEKATGIALKKWFNDGNKRKDLFITAGLPSHGCRAADVEIYLNESLKNLGLDYVDMYVIMAPVGVLRMHDSLAAEKYVNGRLELDKDTDHISTWKAMEAQVKAGRTRSIGLRNFNETQIQNIINSAEIKPSNLQIEVQVYYQNKNLRSFCEKNNIAITALNSFRMDYKKHSLTTFVSKQLTEITELPVVKEIAEAHNKTATQVLLRHQVQEGLLVAPFSASLTCIRQYMDIFNFELTKDELGKLDALDKGEKGRLFQLESFKGKHRHYPFSIHP